MLLYLPTFTSDLETTDNRSANIAIGCHENLFVNERECKVSIRVAVG